MQFDLAPRNHSNGEARPQLLRFFVQIAADMMRRYSDFRQRFADKPECIRKKRNCIEDITWQYQKPLFKVAGMVLPTDQSSIARGICNSSVVDNEG